MHLVRVGHETIQELSLALGAPVVVTSNYQTLSC